MSLRVIHIEDEADIREVVALSLGLDPEFADIRSCSSGKEGIAAAREQPPDIILLDVMMPSMDGPETLARLRTDPRTAAIPVIFVTTRASPDDVRGLISLGALGVIAKPFDPLTLAALVRRHVRAADPLAAMRTTFLTRVRNDADALFHGWSALAGAADPGPVLRAIRSTAHGLAGASGIFGFPEIGDAAADLEDSIIVELHGANEPDKIERALEVLLTVIAARLPGGKIAHIRPMVDA
jgi:CheY-like chemotaxis protein